MPTVHELKATHGATVAAIQTALMTGKMAPEQAQPAADLLAGLAVLIQHDAMTASRIEDVVRTERLRDGRDPTQTRAV